MKLLLIAAFIVACLIAWACAEVIGRASFRLAEQIAQYHADETVIGRQFMEQGEGCDRQGAQTGDIGEDAWRPIVDHRLARARRVTITEGELRNRLRVLKPGLLHLERKVLVGFADRGELLGRDGRDGGGQLIEASRYGVTRIRLVPQGGFDSRDGRAGQGTADGGRKRGGDGTQQVAQFTEMQVHISTPTVEGRLDRPKGFRLLI
jgi:hypothetical protein